MPFAGYKDFADCVAKNSDKSDPDAYCGYIKHQTESRHVDFQRIYDEFLNYYKDRVKGESEYSAWLKALRLDETKQYGWARESFQWAKDMLQYLREDKDNKYYSILLGFPIKSMNGNVYRERDLIAAALSLKGKHPSLNHKTEFWFSPKNKENKWGTLTVADAKYEDGAIETILQVPKEAVCPICNGAKMTHLIDSKRIVNVSLEGECLGGVCYDGTCEGFTFTDPPFTLLTTDVLPGIPLARIKPLESIMVEALQSSTRKKPKMKVKAKVTEDTKWSGTIDGDLRGTTPTPIKQDSQIDTHADIAKAVVGTNAAGEGTIMKSGDPMTDVNKQQTPRIEQSTPPDSGYEQPSEVPTADTSMPKPEDEREGPSKTSPPPSEFEPSDLPTGAPSDMPKQEKPEVEAGEPPPKATVKVPVGTPTAEQEEEPQPSSRYCDEHPEDPRCIAHKKAIHGEQAEEEPCPTGQHRDAEGNCVSDEEPVESLPSLEERRARVHAEFKAKSSEEKAIAWEQKHNEIYEKYSVLTARYRELNRIYESFKKDAKRERDQAGQRVQNATIRLEQALSDYNRCCGEKTTLDHQYEDLTNIHNDVTRKYNEALNTNLQLSKKLTSANEDYLEIARAKENLEEKLTRARTNAKKTLKIKV